MDEELEGQENDYSKQLTGTKSTEKRAHRSALSAQGLWFMSA